LIHSGGMMLSYEEAGTDIAKKTFKLDSFWWDDAII